ncbi:MAG: thiamine diphosphokinase [Oscillospiraceae bacterium]|nr:thiamine diphosphokinase [Oscillospiraceae bacterium]
MDIKSAELRRCVICGAAPVENINILKPLLHEDDWVIAADGGINLAKQLGLEIGQIVADFDSISREQADDTDAPVSLLPVKKNDTDTMAAARIGLEHGFKNFLLLGASGGRLDHTFGNLAVMLFLVQNNAKAVLADEHNIVEMHLPGRVIVEPVKDCFLSLLPYGGTVSGLTVHNAEYELVNATLTPDYPLGVSNEFLNRSVEIFFKQGVLMIFLSKD